jgi:tetratricopeptide (TPR) repeat protein
MVYKKKIRLTMKNLNLFALLVLAFFSLNASAQNAACPKWGADSVKATQEISLYREFLKQNNFKDALPHWRYVFLNAPGARQTTHVDGVKLFKTLADAEKDAAKKEKYIDTILMIYDQRLNCFGLDGEVIGRKGTEMLNYKSDEKATYETLKKSVELEKSKAPGFIMYSYVLSAVNAWKKQLIDTATLLIIYNDVTDMIDKNVKNNVKDVEKYKETQSSIDELIASTGILNCDNLKAIFEKQYKETPDDKALLNKIYNQMRTAKCADDPLFIEVTEKLYESEPDEGKARVLAYAYISTKNYSKVVTYFKAAAEFTTENDKKAEYWMKIAEIQQNQGDYESSRASALKAASLKPGWGDPYLHIGDLYASSGSRCGSGTGFESQVVTWAAVDMYEKAKSVDGSVTGKANSQIAKYKQYMPSKEECFFRNIKEGDSFKVNCWINETTKVRYGTPQ